MNRQYRRHYTPDNHSAMRYFYRGNWRQDEFRLEQQRKFDQMAAKNNPQMPQPVAPGDRSVFKGLTIGLILGGIISGVIGALLDWSAITVVCAVLGGVVAGGLLGAWITRLIFNIRNLKEKQHSKKQAANDKTHA